MPDADRDEQARALLAEGLSIREVALRLDCAPATVYRAKLSPGARTALRRTERVPINQRRPAPKPKPAAAVDFTDPEAILRDVAGDRDAQDAARVQAAKLLRDTAGVTADTITELRDVILSAVERHCDEDEGDALVADIQDHLPAQLREIWG